MKLKIVMNSGKEYITEKYSSVENFLDTSMPNKSNTLSWVSLDDNKTIYISAMHVSSIECLQDSPKNVDDDDLVYFR